VTANGGGPHNRSNLKEIPMPHAHESSNFLRRKRLLLIPPLMGLLAGLLISFLFAARYISSAKVSLKIPAPSGYAMNSSSITEEFEFLTQLALSATRMRPAVHGLNLVKPGQAEDKLMEDIRAHVVVTPQNIPGDLTPIFYVGYSDSNPRRAQNICQMLTALMVNESQRDRDDLLPSSSTLEFLERQLDDSKARVTAIEKELTKYRKKGTHRSAEEEFKYQSLSHNYEEAKSFYNILSQKRAQAEISFQLERNSEKVRIILLSPASLPGTPAFPNRALFAASGLASGLMFEILLMLYLSGGAAYPGQPSAVGTNWWGLSSTVGLFAWFLYYFKNEPHTFNDYVLFWGGLALIHFCGINAARRRYGWLYLTPLGVFWAIVAVALYE